MTTSLGEEAICGNLTVNNLTYKTLNPAVSGFVQNPLNAELRGGGNNIDLQGGDLTASTINYTALNPPLPTGTIVNPLNSDILGNNQNVGTAGSKVNEFRGTTGTFDNSSLGVATGTSLNTNSLVVGAGGGSCAGSFIHNNSLTATGAVLFTNNLLTQSDFTNQGQSYLNNLHIFDKLSVRGATLAGNSKSAPYNTTTSPTPELDLTGKSRGAIWIVGPNTGGFFTIRIKTGVANAEENVSVWSSYQQGVTVNPVELVKRVAVDLADPPNSDTITFTFTITTGNLLTIPARINFLLIKDTF